jgi:hypothetical protein
MKRFKMLPFQASVDQGPGGTRQDEQGEDENSAHGLQSLKLIRGSNDGMRLTRV